MAKQSNGDPYGARHRMPGTTRDKEDRVKEMNKLGTRGMLLRVLEVLGDERISDEQLRRALIILEDLEPENPGA